MDFLKILNDRVIQAGFVDMRVKFQASSVLIVAWFLRRYSKMFF